MQTHEQYTYQTRDFLRICQPEYTQFQSTQRRKSDGESLPKARKLISAKEEIAIWEEECKLRDLQILNINLEKFTIDFSRPLWTAILSILTLRGLIQDARPSPKYPHFANCQIIIEIILESLNKVDNLTTEGLDFRNYLHAISIRGKSHNTLTCETIDKIQNLDCEEFNADIEQSDSSSDSDSSL